MYTRVSIHTCQCVLLVIVFGRLGSDGIWVRVGSMGSTTGLGSRQGGAPRAALCSHPPYPSWFVDSSPAVRSDDGRGAGTGVRGMGRASGAGWQRCRPIANWHPGLSQAEGAGALLAVCAWAAAGATQVHWVGRCSGKLFDGGRESLRAVEREIPHGTAARVRWNRGPQSGGTHAAHHLPSVHLSPPAQVMRVQLVVNQSSHV